MQRNTAVGKTLVVGITIAANRNISEDGKHLRPGRPPTRRKSKTSVARRDISDVPNSSLPETCRHLCVLAGIEQASRFSSTESACIALSRTERFCILEGWQRETPRNPS